MKFHLVRAAARTSLSILSAWNISDSSFMKAIFRSRHSGRCRLTAAAHAKVLLTKSNGAKRCAALASAASRCVNEPNGLKSTQESLPPLDERRGRVKGLVSRPKMSCENVSFQTLFAACGHLTSYFSGGSPVSFDLLCGEISARADVPANFVFLRFAATV
jgi:hypothetical protein